MASTDPADSSDPAPTVTNEPPPATRHMTLTEIISGVKRRSGAFPMSSSEKSKEGRSKRRRSDSAVPEEEPAPATPRPSTPPPQDEEPPQDQAVAPQVTLDAKGNIVVDPDSLVVSENTARPSEDDHRTVTLDSEALGTRITSATYGKRESAHKWSEQETDRFYQALRMFGTDFSLMERTFPKRSRRQLKLKFKREEKENPKRVDETLKAPSLPIPRIIANVPASEGSQVTAGDGVTRSAGQQQDSGDNAAMGSKGDSAGEQADGQDAAGKETSGVQAVRTEGRGEEAHEGNGGENAAIPKEARTEGQEGNSVDNVAVKEKGNAEGNEGKVMGKTDVGTEGSGEECAGKSRNGQDAGNEEGCAEGVEKKVAESAEGKKQGGAEENAEKSSDRQTGSD